jgi:hypothetical protein
MQDGPIDSQTELPILVSCHPAYCCALERGDGTRGHASSFKTRGGPHPLPPPDA